MTGRKEWKSAVLAVLNTLRKKETYKAQITTVSKKLANINNDQAEKCVLAGDLNDCEQVAQSKDLMGHFKELSKTQGFSWKGVFSVHLTCPTQPWANELLGKEGT